MSSITVDRRPVLIEHHEPNCFVPYDFEVFNNNKISPEAIKKILVVKLDHIGDLILSLPAVKVLRNKFPDARIAMIVGSWAKTIAERVSYIDEVLTFDFFDQKSEKGIRRVKKRELKSLQKKLCSYNFDLAVDLRKNPETRAILKLSGAKYTVGFSNGNDSNQLSLGFKINRVIENTPGRKYKPHITSQLCRLVDIIPSNNIITTEITKIELPELKRGNKFPVRYSFLLENNFLVGVHPGAGNSIKQWPMSYFAHLIDMVIERSFAKVILFGGSTDREAALEILRQVRFKDNVISIAGETTLEDFIAITEKCDLFIGNDSGPCHIAGLLEIPTLTIFSGNVSSYEWHPLGKKILSIRVDLNCNPCYLSRPEQCPYDLRCLKFLWPEKVWEAVQQLLIISGKEPFR